MSRGCLRAVPGDQDQVLRLQRFREEHPGIIISHGEFDTWQAHIPRPAVDIFITRHRLADLLDELDDLVHGGRLPGHGLCVHGSQQ